MNHLKLFTPSLLGPLSAMELPGFPNEPAPALQTLLRGAQQQSGATGLPATLLGAASLPHLPSADWPVAAVSMAVAAGVSSCGWLCATPVHLRPDRDGLVLFDASPLKITASEADALIAAINAVYTDAGWRLQRLAPSQWYWQLPQPPQLITTELAGVIGRDIRRYLPQGEQALFWRQRLNEVQMILHQHPLNQQREQQGKPMINSIWLWGGGALPLFPSTAPPFTSLWANADEALVQGLAALAQIPLQPEPTEVGLWLKQTAGAEVGVVLSDCVLAVSYDDATVWLQTMADLDQRWFAPLVEALNEGILQRLTIYPCHGHCYTIQTGWYWQLARRWRRARPLRHF